MPKNPPDPENSVSGIGGALVRSAWSLGRVEPHFVSLIMRLGATPLRTDTYRCAWSLGHTFSENLDQSKHWQLYCVIIHVLTKEKWYSKATCLTKELVRTVQEKGQSQPLASSVFDTLGWLKGPKFTSEVFNVLVIAFCQMGRIDEASWVFRKIGSLPVIQACNAPLNGLLKIGRYESVWEMYQDMLLGGLCPNVVTYNTLINACCDEGLLDEMEDEPAGDTPNIYTYNVLMDGHCKTLSVHPALELYREMLGNGLQPNVVTYSTFRLHNDWNKNLCVNVATVLADDRI
ncbi:pentatricopeptide repeat-containing protein At5g61400-like [Aristolochia californica]|uniref:pentatricopeptide repeat-containing protein At5g61400-like n=1 Tax=Aristolochia californica TaxID=171875 RepID=UPI0035DBBFE7